MFRVPLSAFILFLPLFLAAQDPEGKERIRLVHANSLEFDRSMGDEARRLIGDVRFEHGAATMDCDSAYLYADRERLKAYGNVHIIHNDSIHLYGDSLHYSGVQRKARLRSNVRVEDPEMTLRTDTLDYDIARSLAHYREGGTIEVHDSEQRLKSKKGTYDADEQRMYFKDDVVLTHPDYRLFSDTLEYETAHRIAHFRGPTVMRTGEEVVYCEGGWYDLEADRSLLTRDPYISRGASIVRADTFRYRREHGEGKASGRVFLRNYEKALRGFAGKGKFMREGSWMRLTDDPVLYREFEDDTLFLRGDTVRAVRDTVEGSYRMMAWPDVRFFKRDLQGRCDSLSYEEADSTTRLFHDPVLWSGADRIAGDTIRIHANAEGIRQVEIPSSPFLSSKKDTPYFDQMRGRYLKAYFDEDDRIRRIKIEGNGRTLHFPEEEGEEEKLTGMNRTESADIDIRFEDGEMRSVRFIREPTATLFPMEDLNEERIRLEGFRWDEKGRASDRADILEGSWIEGKDELLR